MPSQSLMATSADQFRLPSSPASVAFAASRVAQSDTRPGLAVGLGTAMALEHWAVNWAGMGMGSAVVAGAFKAVAPSAPVSSSEIAIADASARAVAVLARGWVWGF